MFLKSSFQFFLLLLCLLFPSTEKIISSNIYAELSIPKLNLKESIYLKDSKYNDVTQEFYLFLAEEESSQMVILSHSRNEKVSYFNHLDDLQIFDEIIVTIKGTRYFFKVMDIYQEEKDGKIIIKNSNEMSLTLVICTKYTNHLQTIIIAKNTGKLIKKD